MGIVKAIHPGIFIKSSVIPEGVSVKEAARLLGVGRPALSNLLNGKADLSQEMAARIQKTFGFDAKQLIKIQVEFDEHQFKKEASAIAVQNYVPSFLSIRSNQIDAWADGIEARSRLAVLLRKLVNSTGSNLSKVDFPGYDNAERHGWDGEIETASATPWIPIEKSGWEFGCTDKPLTKAKKDYANRTKATPPEEREKINFVFVTPRHWNDKDEWAKEKEKLKEWKTVRAFDANDLEQWLEQSIQAQSWFGEQIGLSQSKVETLERHWDNWSSSTEPKLTKEIFGDSISQHRNRIKTWLDKAPATPLVLAADSRGEALSFLACLFNSEGFIKYQDMAVIFHSEEELGRLSLSTLPLIPIIVSDKVQQKIGNIFRSHHTIIISPKNAVEKEPDIVLDQLGHVMFIKVIESMGMNRSEADRLARESGYSPTILRRRLSVLESNRIPDYHKEDKAIQYMIPFTLIGAWHSQTQGDKDILSFVANDDYNEIEKQVAYLMKFEESPVWAVGTYRGVASKLESLFVVRNSITIKDLNNFFNAAKTVLSEEDPALQLPEENRWAANLYGKTRNHSSIIRQRICETLVLLAVHGNNLFKDRLGENIQYRVDDLIKSLMLPLSLNKILSLNKDMTYFAEASPEVFINIIEEDLKSSDPITLQLMKPANTDIFSGGAIRTDLLWALEGLAWNPERMLRVSYILARLSTKVIDDNYLNKPMNSLESIFRSWIPQTAANLEQRKKALSSIVKRFPSIGWRICIDQFDRDQTGHYSHRPHWRNDASGFGNGTTKYDRNEFVKEAFEIALSFPDHTVLTLGDLVQRIQNFPENHQLRIWDKVEIWLNDNNNDQQKSQLRERIRSSIFTYRKYKDQSNILKERAQTIYNMLAPVDVVTRNQWLFKEQWLGGAIEGLDEDDHDYRKRDKAISDLRLKALHEIWNDGFNSIIKLATVCGTPHLIGWYLTKEKFSGLDEVQFVKDCLNENGEASQVKMNELIAGFLRGLPTEGRMKILNYFTSNHDIIVRLLLNAPCDKQTWDMVENCGRDISDQYWRKVKPFHNLNAEQANELVEKLLIANRPRTAFQSIYLQYENIETSKLKLLLQRLPYIENENEIEVKFEFTGFDISLAMKTLEQRPGVTEEEMASLEFIYVNVLSHSEHGIPNLQRQIIKSPTLFLHVLAMTYNRTDNGQDPVEWDLPDRESRKRTFSLTYTLLQKIRIIPGVNEDGSIVLDNLRKWIFEVRELCNMHARAKVGDQAIGQILSSSPIGKNGVWPCEEVCEVLEELAAPEIANGVNLGVFNSRGAVWGSEGKEEKELANKYRAWADKTAFEFPFVSKMLREIAQSFESHAEWMNSRNSIEEKLGY